jgi:hypothetical protein
VLALLANWVGPGGGSACRVAGAIAKPRFVGELGLTDAEEDAIVAFLGTLSDGANPNSQSSLACALSASFHQCCASICGLAWKAVRRLFIDVPARGQARSPVLQAQSEDYCRQRRACSHCRLQRLLKDVRARRPGLVVRNGRAPRAAILPCGCAVARWHTLNPVAETMPDGCRPEYERVIAKMGLCLRTGGLGHCCSYRSMKYPRWRPPAREL